MTPRSKLWRAVHVDENGKTVLFVLEAPDADTAAEEAEYQTGLPCVFTGCLCRVRVQDAILDEASSESRKRYRLRSH